MARAIPLGQILLSLPVLQILIANYFVDVLSTHICNPEWDGHARYHNAQAMDMLIWLEIMSLIYTWRSYYQVDLVAKKESLMVAALTGSAFMATGILAPIFPGRLCLDQGVPAGEPGTPGGFIYGIPLVVIWAGYWLACRQVGQPVTTKAGGIDEHAALTSKAH